MKHIFISHFAILIAFVSAVNSCSKTISENSKFATTFEEGATTHKHWNLSRPYGSNECSHHTVIASSFASDIPITDLRKTIAERNESQKLLCEFKSELTRKVQTLTSQVKDLTNRIHHYDQILDAQNSRIEAAEKKMEKDFVTQIAGKHYSDPNLEDIKQISRLYHEEVLELASRIHEKYMHGTVSAEDTQTIGMLKKELPKSLTVLIFSPGHVYIKNNYFNQFLEAYASSRFRVPSIEFDKIGSWRLQKDGDHWNIENNSNNEFLFYSCEFSQLPKLRTSDKSLDTEWLFFFKPDGVQFMHKRSSKFLCVDMEEHERPDQWYHNLALWGTEEQKFIEWCTWELVPREY